MTGRLRPKPRTRGAPSAVAILGLLAVSCVAPSVTPETKAIFERSSASVHPERPRVPWEVGQWVLLRTSRSRSESIFRLFGHASAPLGYRRIAVTGREGTAWWLESHEVTGRRDLRLALLIDGFDASHMDRLRVLRLRRLGPDGRTTEVARGGDADLWARADALVAGLHFASRHGRLRTISVPAGTFESANAVPVSFSTTLGSSSGYLLYTNAVPVVYYAKRVTRRTSSLWFHDVETVELVDFGLTEPDDPAP